MPLLTKLAGFSPEDVFDAHFLPEEGVNDGRSARDEGRLTQIAQHAEHGVKLLEVGLRTNPEK